MNDNVRNAQVTIQQMKRLMTVLDDLGQKLPNNPKVYAFMTEAPIDDLTRMLRELDESVEPLKHVASGSKTATPIVDTSTSNSAVPGPIESAS
jgi:hypothetical protein